MAEPSQKAVLQRARELWEQAGYKDPFDFTADAKGTSFSSEKRREEFIGRARAELRGKAGDHS